MTPQEFYLNTCTQISYVTAEPQPYDVASGRLLAYGSIYPLQKLSPSKFVVDMSNETFMSCERADAAPDPVSELAAVLKEDAISVSWTAAASDPTNFRIESRPMFDGGDYRWLTLGTTSSSQRSFTAPRPGAGTYGFRVLATNDHGESMSSSEVQVLVP